MGIRACEDTVYIECLANMVHSSGRTAHLHDYIRVHARASLKTQQTNKNVVQHTHQLYNSYKNYTSRYYKRSKDCLQCWLWCARGELSSSDHQLIGKCCCQDVRIHVVCSDVLTWLKQKDVTYPLHSHNIAPTFTYTSTYHLWKLFLFFHLCHSLPSRAYIHTY